MTKFFDCDGNTITRGCYVHLVEVLSTLLTNLPEEDQRAICEAARQPLYVSALKKKFIHDNIELEFTDKTGTKHWIYVAGKHLRLHTEPVVRIVGGRLVGPSLADPGMDARIEQAQHDLFPTRQAAIDHFKKLGVLTPAGRLTKAYR